MAEPPDRNSPLPLPPLRNLGGDSSRDDVPVIDMASRSPLPELAEMPEPGPPPWIGQHPLAPAAESEPDVARQSMFWFTGDVLMCACPECGAPMTVRLWLMIADCWRCETCIELTEEQEREARRLYEQRHAHPPVALAASAPHTQQVSHKAAVGVDPSVPTTRRSEGLADGRRPLVAHEPAAPPRLPSLPEQTARQILRRRPAGRVTSWLDALLRNMPAWLISLLFHVILLTILGLLTSDEAEGPYITLSSRVHRVVREGGDVRIVDPTDDATFDLGVPDVIDLKDPAMRRAMVRADQDARELRLIDPDNPHVPDVTKIKEQVGSEPSTRRTLAARDPRLRVEMVKREGGTTLTEAAVARGLRWLSRHQNSDGSWSLDSFHRAGNCRCGDRGRLHSDSAATSLALLPFLGAGQTHLSGIYRSEVSRGLRWLIQNQAPDGDVRGSSGQYPGMYAQGQGAIVLCEAFLMTGDEELRIPAQTAIDFIVQAQYPDGGWRYFPNGKTRTPQGDTSVVGWQLMAIQSALAAGLSVPEATLENAGHFLDTVQTDDGARYSYLPRERPSAAMTAEALLCRVYLGWKQNHPSLVTGVNWLLDTDPPSLEHPNIYYWYYATQTMHHFGGRSWEEWNLAMRDVLVASQDVRGHEAGSWTPDGPLSSQGGRLYMTSLAVCCLEIYYRHLPIFRRIDLD